MTIFKKQNIKFDKLDSIDDISNNFFYLTGKFIGKYKKDLAQEIDELGGISQDLKKKPGVKPKETNYLVIGGNGYNEPTHGENYQKVASWNIRNPLKKIPVISQEHCEELLEQYRSENKLN